MRPYPITLEYGTFAQETSERPRVERAAKLAIVRVLYHSVELRPLDWSRIYLATTGAADTSDPGAGGKPGVQWLQYKLDELGYVAGPLTATHVRGDADRTSRALRRFTHAADGTLESDDDGAQNVRALLAAGRHARADLIETPQALVDARTSSRVLLDHDYFYDNAIALHQPYVGQGEASKSDGNADLDAKKLDGIEIPLAVAVKLVSAADASGRTGIAAPAAVGRVKIEWDVVDAAAPASIPARFTTNVAPTDATAAPKYLAKVRDLLADPIDGGANCPAARGGSRPEDATDMRPYFVAGGLPDCIDDEVLGKRYLSHCCTKPELSRLAPLVGTSAALFRTSLVAGDGWVVRARLSLEGLPRRRKLEADHAALPALAGAFGADKDRDPLAIRTGPLTLWRRHHVRKVVDWWSYGGAPAIGWDVIVDAFAAAFIVLERPALGDCTTIARMVDPAAKQRYVDGVKAAATAQGNAIFAGRDALLEWSDRAIVPLRWPPQHPTESLRQWVDGTSATAMVNTLNGQGGFAYAMYRAPAEFVEERIGRGARPGFTIVRFDHFEPKALPALLNASDRDRFQRGKLQLEVYVGPKKESMRVDATTYPSFAELRNYKDGGGPSIGVDRGFTFISHPHFEEYTDAFIVLHEMGHCLYLTHCNNDLRGDHDREDMNCAMWYPSETSLLASEWGKRKTTKGKTTMPIFCGKCLLKLRGWRIADGRPGTPNLPRDHR